MSFLGGEEKRKEHYDTLASNFYDLVTDFYEYGWGESFHFAPRHNLESFPQSIARYELYIALRLGKFKRILENGGEMTVFIKD